MGATGGRYPTTHLVSLVNARRACYTKFQMSPTSEGDTPGRLSALGPLGEEWSDLEPLLPLARALHEEIDGRLAGSAETGLLDVDAMIDEALRKLGVQHATEMLLRLSPDAFLELYVRYVGADAFADLLRSRAAGEQPALERALRLERIASETTASSLLRLALLEAGDVITVGVFQGFGDEAHRESRVPPNRLMTFRVLDPAAGHAELLHDRIFVKPGGSPVGALREHSRGTLGTLVHESHATLEPTLSTHGRLSYRVPGLPTETVPGIIGFIETADGRLLLNGR
jgi:hypothetical protein